MAGLLETIARRLLSGSEPKKTVRTVRKTVPKTAYSTNSTATVKADAPIPSARDEDSVANTWVMNSTITESEAVEIDVLEERQESVVTEIDRTIKRERTNREVGREDYLLNQIDEFREKAQQLQELLLSKESKVAELQNIVDEREGKARELEDILTERQKKADGITEEMTKQIDSLIGKVAAKMDEIGISINESMNASVSVVGREISESRQLSEKQLAELQELKDLLATLTPQLENVKAELSDKVHTENVKCYRNISDLFKSMEDKMDKMEEIQKSVGSVRKCAVAIIVFTILNMLGLVALALYELGVFQMLLG